ncbi:MAG TPA: hypothetical protein PLI18_18015 [Pirellulaceae bacterium]|nr:hypothetical protein [Pirellulaceae bacterium]
MIPAARQNERLGVRRATSAPLGVLMPWIVGIVWAMGSGASVGDDPSPSASPGAPIAPAADDSAADASAERLDAPRSRNAWTERADLVLRLFDFESETCDVNYDTWPDDWTRRTGRGFPSYLKVGIGPFSEIGAVRSGTARPNASGTSTMPMAPNRPSDSLADAPRPFDCGKQALGIRMDGGAAEISSPPIPINSHYSYALDGWVLLTPSGWSERNEAWISLTLSDRDGTLRQTHRSQQVEKDGEWTHLRLGPVIPSDPAFEFLTVTLHVRPTRVEDVFGEAWFDAIRVSHLPKLNAKTSHPFNLFHAPDEVEIVCLFSGMEAQQGVIEYHLTDIDDRTIARRRLGLRGGQVMLLPDEGAIAPEDWPEPPRAGVDDDPIDDMSVAAPGDPSAGTNGTDPSAAESKSIRIGPDVTRDVGDEEWIRWRPTVPGFGFYRATVRLTNTDGIELSRELSMAVMPEPLDVRSPQFGWNVPRQPESVSFASLVELFRDGGISWVMYPVWYAPDDPTEGQRLGDLAERLTLERMELIALLDSPPASLRTDFSSVEDGVSSTFRDEDSWLPAIEHVLTRLSFKIDWWQLGSPDDESFVGQNQLAVKIAAIRSRLQRFGKNIRVGLTWDWLYESPDPLEHLPAPTAPTRTVATGVPLKGVGDPAWDFLLRSGPSPFTAEELSRHLRDVESELGPVWTTLQPLDADNYDLETRVRDLIERMVAIRMSNAAVALVPDPISSYNGLLNDDLSPTELLLPFRTASYALAGAEYVGSIELPSRAPNHVFRRGREMVMVIWSDHDTSEAVSLGENLQSTDCWGRTTALPSEQGKTVLRIGHEPQFVSGLEAALVDWQMKTRLGAKLIPSVIGQQQYLTVLFDNTFAEGVAGTVTVSAEGLWDQPQIEAFKASPGEPIRLDFPFALRPSVSTDKQQLEISFDVAGHRRHRFRLERDIEIGIPDVYIDTAVQDDGNKILIHATVVNDSEEPVNFNLYLFAPDRKRLRAQVTALEPGRQRRTFIVDDAADMMDRAFWLRAEEMRGNRVLNYRIPGPKSVRTSADEDVGATR